MLYKNKKNFFSLPSYAGEIALIISAIFGLVAFFAIMLLPKIGWLAGIATTVTIFTLFIAVVLLTLDVKQSSIHPSEIDLEGESFPSKNEFK